jgi:hypothetical protein
MVLHFPLDTACKTSTAPVAFSTNGPTARRLCWLSGTAECMRASWAQNPYQEWTGSCVSGWRPSSPGRPFGSFWSPYSLTFAIILPLDIPFSISVLGLQTILESGPWTKSRTNTSWRAPGCHFGVLRSGVRRTGPFESFGFAARSTPPCLLFLTSCWIAWHCPSRPPSMSTVKPGEITLTKIASGTTSSEWW